MLQADSRADAASLPAQNGRCERPRWPRKRRSQHAQSPAHDHHSIRPLIRHGNARHFMLCYKLLYHKERMSRADLGGREAERTQAFSPYHFFSLSLFVLCFIRLICLWFRDVWFWKLLQSGPPRPNIWRPVSLSFIMSLVSPTRRCPENRNPAFSDWNNPNTTVCIRNPRRMFSQACSRVGLSHEWHAAAEWMCARNALLNFSLIYLFSNKDESHI